MKNEYLSLSRETYLVFAGISLVMGVWTFIDRVDLNWYLFGVLWLLWAVDDLRKAYYVRNRNSGVTRRRDAHGRRY